ncbi:hypothetical protein RRG08_005304 [Elysia crispata]|uniref:Uncharacterized protein n=1 Tax=Elysia crispata TaxID=231223 RepID=A0AAE0Y7V1_9GAST|nr:hypothetical protein RRG08_005304 [Elysia crispata]
MQMSKNGEKYDILGPKPSPQSHRPESGGNINEKRNVERISRGAGRIHTLRVLVAVEQREFIPSGCILILVLAVVEQGDSYPQADWSHWQVHKNPVTMEKLTVFIVLLCFACYIVGSLAAPEGKMMVKRQNPVALMVASFGPLVAPALALGLLG